MVQGFVMKIHNIYDLENILDNLSHKINFRFNGVNYGAMIGDDGNVIVRNHKTQTSMGKKQFLLQIKNAPFLC